MDTIVDCTADVMQVCRNGHVITDLLHTYPERALSHCGRCGASTVDRCATCGTALPGAMPVPGLVPVGRSQPPAYCSLCGAPFPWTKTPAPAPDPLGVVEPLLRRLPRMVRELRLRHGDRPPFVVKDERDLEDLLRALLPLHFDQVRPENRTPSYAPGTRMDFVLATEGLAVTVKQTIVGVPENALTTQWREDVGYYEQRGGVRMLLGLVYDPQGQVMDPGSMEIAWSRSAGDLKLHCVI